MGGLAVKLVGQYVGSLIHRRHDRPERAAPEPPVSWDTLSGAVRRSGRIAPDAPNYVSKPMKLRTPLCTSARRWSALVSFALLTACQGSEDLPDLRGLWSYTAEDMVGDGFTCEVSGTTLDIDDFGRLTDPLGGGFIAEFTGTFSGGTLTCVDGGGGTFTSDVVDGAVDGTMDNFNVTFELESNSWSNDGVFDIGSQVMSGVVFRRVTIDGTLAQLTGDFTVVRAD